MKVLIDATTTQDEKADHGIGRYTLHMIEALVRKYPMVQFRVLLFDGASTLDKFLKKSWVNLEVVRIGKLRSNNYLNFYWFSSQFAPVIDKYKNDHIYFAPYFWRGLPVGQMPVVTAIHDLALMHFNIYSEQSPIHNLIRKYQYWSEMRKVAKSDAIFACSEFTRQDILRHVKGTREDRVHTIHLGLEMEEIELDVADLLPKDYEKRGYFIYLGGSPYKNKNSSGVIRGYYNFIKFLSGADIAKIPYLVIAGGAFMHENDSNVRLRQEIEALGLKDYVHFTGRYEDKQKYSLLKNSIGLIHLSLFEGFGFAVAEAMRAKVPVIAHDGTSYPEVVEDGGILVDGKNEQEVGQALKWIYENRGSDSVQKLTLKGYKRSLDFQWERSAIKAMKVLEDVWQTKLK